MRGYSSIAVDEFTVYIDENVNADVAVILRASGYRVHTTGGEGRLGATDHAQLHLAATRGWVFVTNNRRDLSMLHEAWVMWGVAPPHGGILTMDQGPVARVLAGAIHALLRDTPLLINVRFDWRAIEGWTRDPISPPRHSP